MISDTEVYDFLVNYIQSKGYSPSVRDIRDGLGGTSVDAVHKTLTRLRNKGLIDWQNNQARTIHLIKTE